MPKPKIRIKLKGFDHKILDLSAQQIVEAVERTGAVISGPLPLPTHIKKFSVIRSPVPLFLDRCRYQLISKSLVLSAPHL